MGCASGRDVHPVESPWGRRRPEQGESRLSRSPSALAGVAPATRSHDVVPPMLASLHLRNHVIDVLS